MRNTKKTQEIKYPSIFMIYNTVEKGSLTMEYFDSVEEARDYIGNCEENYVIIEYSPVAVFSPPKTIEWTREPLNE